MLPVAAKRLEVDSVVDVSCEMAAVVADRAAMVPEAARRDRKLPDPAPRELTYADTNEPVPAIRLETLPVAATRFETRAD